MRRIRWIILAVLTALIISFVLSNRQPVSVVLWPFGVAFELPLVAVMFLCLVAGFLVGAILFWWRSRANRDSARAAIRALQQKERELAEARTARPAAKAVAERPRLEVRALPAVQPKKSEAS